MSKRQLWDSMLYSLTLETLSLYRNINITKKQKLLTEQNGNYLRCYYKPNLFHKTKFKYDVIHNLGMCTRCKALY